MVTGVSGSGKSSLTMDTLYAEGQRRYVESLSSYARQFLGRMKKPDVDYILGICPAIAVEQKVSTSNARSTVGTLTEIYDYLRLLFARAGITLSPISGREVKKQSVTDVVDYVQSLPEDTKLQLLAPLHLQEGQSFSKLFEYYLQRGFSRVRVDGQIVSIEEVGNEVTTVDLLIDRFSASKDEENLKRIADSTGVAFEEGRGVCVVSSPNHEDVHFSNKFELDGILFEEPSPNLFNYNNPYGACPKCEGYGKILGIDEDKVIPDKSLCVLDECVACWKGEVLSEWRKEVVKNAHHIDFPVHRAYQDLTKEQRKVLWKGCKHFKGIDDFFKELESQAYKIQNRVMLARYRGKTDCDLCEGSRLRKDAGYVKIGEVTIDYLTSLPIEDLAKFFKTLELPESKQKIAARILLEVSSRLHFLQEVGLGYLTLNRLSASLSGGETQRINLTRTLGSNLTSSLYILDEPSIGLHPRDTNRLVGVLRKLRDLGNTVVVVEHEEEMIASADYLIDIGPEAGSNGGEVIWAGPYKDIHQGAADSLTAGYMSGRLKVEIPNLRRKWNTSLSLTDVRQNNLKGFDVQFPLGVLTVVTGVSGSGKTTLVKQILYPALMAHFGLQSKESVGHHRLLGGDLKKVTGIEMVNQSPIGKSSRSNPVTYVKAFDYIRDLFAKQQLSLLRGFKPKHFSFNVEGGRCEACQGEGEIVVSMQFLADVRLTCEDCNGKRFQENVLDVQYRGKNIYEVLDMTVDEAIEFFQGEKDVFSKIKPLQDVGLGYVKLGQSSSSLSGGEAQRVKLASFLGVRNAGHILFIFDEPTTGLHFHDITKLLKALNALVESGHTVLVVEHNLDVIKCADWVIDLGPEGGDKGGNLVFCGTPEQLADCKESLTGHFLKDKLK